MLLGLALGSCATPAPPPKNVILLIGDGFGPAYVVLARGVVDRPLSLDSVLVGSAATASASSRVTDSGAGATDLACGGVISYNGAIAVDTDSVPRRTILEAAKARGMAVGLVATSRITHATPACFASHVPNRDEEDAIAEQELATGVDVMLGGGTDPFLPEPAGDRKDGRDLLARARELGYEVVRDRAGLAAARTGKLLGLFARSHLNWKLDRTPAEPTLQEMARVAIQRLGHDPQGFFLMIEGSRIDMAGHANDPANAAREALEFDSTVTQVLAFARRDGHTLVVVTADHETGGLSLGANVDGSPKYEWHPEVLRRVRRSAEAMAKRITDGADPRQVLAEDAGISALADSEVAVLRDAPDRQRGVLVGHMISQRATIGWTTLGHTAVDVPVFALGPGSDRLRGHRHLSGVSREMADVLGVKIGDPVEVAQLDTASPPR